MALSSPPAPPGGGVISVNTCSESAAETLPEQGAEDERQPAEAERGGGDRQAHGDGVAPAAGGVRGPCLASAFRAMRISSSRATASTTKVMRNSTRPSAISEEV